MPPFENYYFVDIDPLKTEELKNYSAKYGDKVKIMNGDCNQILKQQILPQFTWESYQRALCLLDPYGLHLD